MSARRSLGIVLSSSWGGGGIILHFVIVAANEPAVPVVARSACWVGCDSKDSRFDASRHGGTVLGQERSRGAARRPACRQPCRAVDGLEPWNAEPETSGDAAAV